MEIRPILSTLLRHKTAATLIVLQLALTCAIICNAMFMIGDRLQQVNEVSGIAEDELVQVMQPFYRVESSRNRGTGGTGLGLAIVKHALQRHGAQLHISSQLGQGSEFAVLFPAQRLRRQ